jgi:glucoamylase
MEETFGVTGGTIGLPRYEHDNYSRVDPHTLGNWWIITTLWSAQYYAETGRIDDAKRILTWVNSRADTTGVLPEQISPRDDSQVSVSPLTWSHAEYLSTLLDTIDKKQP